MGVSWITTDAVRVVALLTKIFVAFFDVGKGNWECVEFVVVVVKNLDRDI